MARSGPNRTCPSGVSDACGAASAAGEFSALLRRARSGDPEAQGELLHRFERRIDGAIRRQLGFPGGPVRREFDTSDLRQSVFLEALRAMSRVEDRGEEAFFHLLCMKAKSRVARAQRRAFRKVKCRAMERVGTESGRDPVAPGAGPATSAEAEDQRAAEVAAFGEALAALNAGQREIVRLRAAGKTFPDIARLLGLSGEDTARMRHARALKELERRCRQPSS